MSTRPLVTIGLPCYNAAPTILRAINSVLRQTYTNWELLIIDDGSTDRSVATIKEFSHPKCRLVLHKQSAGSHAD